MLWREWGDLKTELVADGSYQPVEKDHCGSNLDADVFDLVAVLMQFLTKSAYLAHAVLLGAGIRGLGVEFAHTLSTRHLHLSSATPKKAWLTMCGCGKPSLRILFRFCACPIFTLVDANDGRLLEPLH